MICQTNMNIFGYPITSVNWSLRYVPSNTHCLFGISRDTLGRSNSTFFDKNVLCGYNLLAEGIIKICIWRIDSSMHMT